MGSFDGAETCKLVALYLLQKLNMESLSNNGLATFNKSLREIQNIKKCIWEIFNDRSLRLTIETNKKCINYLDITLQAIQ